MNTVPLRPNKPARYGPMHNGLVGPLVEDEEPSANAEPSSDALAVLKGLVELLGDQKATQKRVAEFAEAVSKAREADAATQKAEADRARINREIEAAEKQSADKLAAELAAHTVELQRRTLAVEQTERASDKRELELDQREAKLKADRAKLDRKLAIIAAD